MIPSLNLLPWREALQKTRNTQFFVCLAGAALLGGIGLIIGDGWMQYRMGIQQAKVDVLHQAIRDLEPQLLEIQGLESSKAQLIERRDIITALQKERPMIIQLLAFFPESLPNSVYLTRLQRRLEKTESNNHYPKQYRILVEGVGMTNSSISLFLQKLQAMPGVSQAKLNEITVHNKASRDLRFTLEFMQCLSGNG